jgi:MtN3 and saliva related transmembrane protein
MQTIIYMVGTCAAILTAVSYFPQVRKALPVGSTADLSLKMLLLLTGGLLLWILYGILRSDWMIVASNVVGAALSGSVLACKVRDIRRK